MVSYADATVTITLQTGRILPTKDLEVEIVSEDGDETVTDIGRIEEDGNVIKPDDLQNLSPLVYENVNVSITTDTKGSMGGDTYKTLRIYTDD